MPSFRGICDHKHVGCFQLLSNGFLYFETLFSKIGAIFSTLLFFVLLCLIVNEPYYGVVPYIF